MASFPTLTGTGGTPVVGAFSDGFASDPVIRAPKDSGKVKTRARYTAVPRTYHFRYETITTADKTRLRAFEMARVGGADLFSMTMPGVGVLTVRFVAPVTYAPVANLNYTRWNVEFDVETV